MSATESFIRGFELMDRVENRRLDRERADQEYKYLQDQRKYGQVANKIDYLTSTYGQDYEAMAADPTFVEIANDAAFESGFRSADGNKFKLKGFRKNPKSGAMIAYGDTIDDQGNIVKADVPITKNRTGDPNDEIVQLPAKEWIAQANNMLTNWEGYREFNQQRQLRQAKGEFASEYTKYEQGQQAPSTTPSAPRTPFHLASAQAQVPSAQPPAPTANTPSAPAPAVEPTPAAPAAFDPAARLQAANAENATDIVTPVKKWFSDMWNGSAEDEAAIFKNLADPTKADGVTRRQLQDMQQRPKEYAERFVKNYDAISKELGPEKTEQVRKWFAERVKPDANSSDNFKEILLNDRKFKKVAKLNNDLAALQDKLPEGTDPAPLNNAAPQTQKQLARIQRNLPTTPEGQTQVAVDGAAAAQKIQTMKPGARVPTKLRKAVMNLWALDPQAMPLDTAMRFIETGRLTKGDMQAFKVNDTAFGILNKDTGQVSMHYIPGTAALSMDDRLKLNKDNRQAIKARDDRVNSWIDLKYPDKGEQSNARSLANQRITVAEQTLGLNILDPQMFAVFNKAEDMINTQVKDSGWFGFGKDSHSDYPSHTPAILALGLGKQSLAEAKDAFFTPLNAGLVDVYPNGVPESDGVQYANVVAALHLRGVPVEQATDTLIALAKHSPQAVLTANPAKLAEAILRNQQ